MATPVGKFATPAGPVRNAPSNVGGVAGAAPGGGAEPRLMNCTMSVPASVIAPRLRIGSTAMALGLLAAPREIVAGGAQDGQGTKKLFPLASAVQVVPAAG